MLREQTESAVDKNIPSGECEVAKINLGSEEVETTVMPPCKVPLLYPEGFPPVDTDNKAGWKNG